MGVVNYGCYGDFVVADYSCLRTHTEQCLHVYMFTCLPVYMFTCSLYKCTCMHTALHSRDWLLPNYQS